MSADTENETTIARIPVLAFHAIGDGRGPIWTGANDFAKLVDALVASHYQFVTAATVVDWVRGKPLAVKRPLAITFDDGYESVRTAALPILASRGIPATVFAVTGAPGINNWDRPGSFGGGLALLERSGIEQLAAAGWEIGSHTHTHRRLKGCSASEVSSELSRSRTVLAELGTAVTTMAYPYGDHDAVAQTAVRQESLGGFTIGAKFARVTDDVAAICRIDSWYLRSPTIQKNLGNPVGRTYLASRQAARELAQRIRRNRAN